MKKLLIAIAVLAVTFPADAQTYRGRYNGSGRYAGFYRNRINPDTTEVSFTATERRYITPKFTFSSGTVTVNGNAMTTATEYPLAVTQNEAITFVVSDPTAVTAIDMSGDAMTVDLSWFTQFTNLATLVLPDMDPKGYLTDTELVTDGSYPAALTNWTEVETGGTVSVSGGVITVARTDGATSAGQDLLTTGSLYRAVINVTAVSGTCQIQDNDGTSIKAITATGTQSVTFFSKAASGEINVVAVSDGASISFNIFSVKAATTLTTNGGFDADSNWTKSDAALTIGSGVATWTGAQAGDANLSQASSATPTSQYLSRYTMTQTAGIMSPTLKGTELTPRVISGTYKEYVTAGSDANLIYSGDLNFTGTLDNAMVLAWPDSDIGELSDINSLPLTSLTITAASNIGWSANAFDGMTGLKTLYIDGVNWTEAEVTAALASLRVADDAGMTGCTITFINVPGPSDQGFADAMYIAADNTISLPPFAGFTYSGLIAYWPLDDTGATAADLAGSNDGTITGATSTVDATRGRVLSFDGNEDYVYKLSVDSLNFGTGSFTASAWINTSSVARTCIMSKFAYTGVAATETGWYVDVLATGVIRAVVETGGSPVNFKARDSVGTVNNGNWHNITVVRNGTNVYPDVYIDGVLNNGGTLTQGTVNSLSNTTQFTIGREWDYLSEGTVADFSGLIGDVILFNRALSAAEVKQLYEYGL